MLVVDTNIVAYLLIHGDHSAAARELHERDSDWRSEAFLLIELTNVLASSVAAKRMKHSLAESLLATAQLIFDGKLARVTHTLVLATAVQYGVSAYDARFLALAEQLGSRLVTEDTRLRDAAPKLTQSLAEALAPA